MQRYKNLSLHLHFSKETFFPAYLATSDLQAIDEATKRLLPYYAAKVPYTFYKQICAKTRHKITLIDFVLVICAFISTFAGKIENIERKYGKRIKRINEKSRQLQSVV